MKISVIIPIYNCQLYLEKCINSIINQSYENFEIICVNDGSTDGSLNILQKMAKKEKRIVIVDKKNEGAYEARKTGVSLAKGEYITFIDSDDWVDQDYLKKMIDVLEKHKCDIIKVNYYKEYNCKKKKRVVKSFYPYHKSMHVNKENYSELIYPYVIDSYYFNTMCCQLIKKSIIKFSKNRCEIIMGEDLTFNLELLTNSNSIYLLDDYLYYYTYNENSVTTNFSESSVLKKSNDAVDVYSLLFKYADKWNLSSKYHNVIVERVFKEFVFQIVNIFNKNYYKIGYFKFKNYFFDNQKIMNIVDKIPYECVTDKFLKLYKKNFLLFYLYLKYWYYTKIIIKKIIKKILY